mmetsp:Transcript_24177/g.33778  ORF Transcript_24177/g.33778 Transcript_24177/m.33778 type:complete len:329 (-) Transcript_24177:81-1067(-)
MTAQKKSCVSRLFSLAITLGFLGGAGYILWHFLGKPEPKELWDDIQDIDFGDVLKNLTDLDFHDGWLNDPFLSSNATNEWKNGKDNNGLSLTLLNALDENWQEEYEAAVEDWENGNPDALTLTTKRVSVDRDACKKTEQTGGVMMVCNENFGESGWLGINVVAKVGGYIISSVAQMNEFYLFNADIYERQYTMCHEIGHGFGLPHTDESFNNIDLGNCMDYTRTPKNNLHPDESNYARLAGLYGVVGRRRYLKGSSNTGHPRHIRYSSKFHEVYNSAMADLNEELSKAETTRKNGWRILHRHSKGATYSRELVPGISVEVNMLLAPDS